MDAVVRDYTTRVNAQMSNALSMPCSPANGANSVMYNNQCANCACCAAGGCNSSPAPVPPPAAAVAAVAAMGGGVASPALDRVSTQIKIAPISPKPSQLLTGGDAVVVPPRAPRNDNCGGDTIALIFAAFLVLFLLAILGWIIYVIVQATRQNDILIDDDDDGERIIERSNQHRF